MFWRNWKYYTLPVQDSDPESDETALGSEGGADAKRNSRSPLFIIKYHWWLCLLHISLFICSTSVAVYSLSYHPYTKGSLDGTEHRCPKFYVNDEQCTIHMSTVSPLVDAGVITLEWQTLSRDRNTPSAYRGPPSYDREKAWEALQNHGVFNLHPSYIQGLGKTKMLGKVPISTAAGEGYAAFLEVHHQIHCLASLRQWIYKEEYVAQMGSLPKTFHAPIAQVHENLDFCIESLRQTLICNADTTPVLLVADNSTTMGYAPDLSTKHKCRDYNAIVAWEKANQVMI